MTRSGQPGRKAPQADDERDTMQSGAVGAHLGSDIGRGMLGGGQGGDLSVDIGGGRTSDADFADAGDTGGADQGLEGIRGNINEESGVTVEDVTGETPDARYAHGMGAGDPGYTADEDDEGTGRPEAARDDAEQAEAELPRVTPTGRAEPHPRA